MTFAPRATNSPGFPMSTGLPDVSIICFWRRVRRDDVEPARPIEGSPARANDSGAYSSYAPNILALWHVIGSPFNSVAVLFAPNSWLLMLPV